ncbi:ANTAR domain-containing response regulator [Youngiibacter multivorans]|uniref:Stage 0 sporulation protein A homolog n=1 Tax=Youngiibacter multivorans TaxID=937251 RepID=A0ABS4G496_9CLOT|nr:ANTAR domain-containing protein [Youngiibacter multivorans]MBP1919380.1 response regulator NasT [Youngiibacter multivorans]
MKEQTIVIGHSSISVIEKLRSSLERRGYRIYTFQSIEEVLRTARRVKPDIVIMPLEIGGASTVATARVLESDYVTSVVFIVDQPEGAFRKTLETMNLYAYITFPMTLDSLYKTVELAVNTSRKILDLKLKLLEVEKKLEGRITVEKAKGILMKEENMTEEEAFACLRKMAMDMCLPMEKAAKAVVAHGFRKE